MIIKIYSYLTALGKEWSLRQRSEQSIKENNPSKENWGCNFWNYYKSGSTLENGGYNLWKQGVCVFPLSWNHL